MTKTSVTLFLYACDGIDSFRFRDDATDFIHVLFKNKNYVDGLYDVSIDELDIFPFNDEEKKQVIDFIENAKEIPEDTFEALLQTGLLF